MKVKIIGGNHEYDALFRNLGHSLVSTFSVADLVCFTGGEDVSPELYGDNKHIYTHSNWHRDYDEVEQFQIAVKSDVPMVGICRGAQFLNVMNGGRMYQHVTKHAGDHEITDLITGEKVLVSSTHHQMMMMGSEGVLVASSTLHGDREWYDKEIHKKDMSEQDIEVVYYEKTQSLCFQPHPEFSGNRYDPMRNYFANLLDRYLNIK